MIRGMWRSLLVLALVFALNVCPFVCLGHRCAAADEAEACPCCADCNLPEEAPIDDRSDSGCCDCVCDGAVLSARQGDALDHWVMDGVLFVLPVADALPEEGLGSACREFSFASRRPAGRFSGSMLRALRV